MERAGQRCEETERCRDSEECQSSKKVRRKEQRQGGAETDHRQRGNTVNRAGHREVHVETQLIKKRLRGEETERR
jgi:hypothetical protein